ncbi:elongation factor-2 kinase [Aureococcus anophagefferens]|nr:elongation factor-2 kinase [Aureococcus anophagefferens]
MIPHRYQRNYVLKTYKPGKARGGGDRLRTMLEVDAQMQAESKALAARYNARLRRLFDAGEFDRRAPQPMKLKATASSAAAPRGAEAAHAAALGRLEAALDGEVFDDAGAAAGDAGPAVRDGSARSSPLPASALDPPPAAASCARRTGPWASCSSTATRRSRGRRRPPRSTISRRRWRRATALAFLGDARRERDARVAALAATRAARDARAAAAPRGRREARPLGCSSRSRSGIARVLARRS